MKHASLYILEKYYLYGVWKARAKYGKNHKKTPRYSEKEIKKKIK